MKIIRKRHCYPLEDPLEIFEFSHEQQHPPVRVGYSVNEYSVWTIHVMSNSRYFKSTASKMCFVEIKEGFPGNF